MGTLGPSIRTPEIVAKDIDLNDVTEERVARRVEKLVRRFEQEPRVRVALAAVDDEFAANIRLVLEGRELVAKGKSREHVLAAFDEAADRAERRIRRRAAKMNRTDRGLRGGAGEARSDRRWERWQVS